MRMPWKKAGRFVLRVVIWGVVAIVLLVAGVFFALHTRWGREQLRAGVTTYLPSILPGVAIGRIEGSVFGELVLIDVELRDRFGGAAIRASRVVAEVNLVPLLSRKVYIRRAVVERPEVVLRETAQGTVNLAELVELGDTPPDEEKSVLPPWTVIIASAEVRGGSFSLDLIADPLQFHDLDVVAHAQFGPKQIISADRLSGRVQKGEAFNIRFGGHADVQIAEDLNDIGTRLTLDDLLPRGPLQLAAQLVGPFTAAQVRALAHFPDGGTIETKGEVNLTTPLGHRLHWVARQFNPATVHRELRKDTVNLSANSSGQGIPLQPDSTFTADVDLRNSTLGGQRVNHLSLRGRAIEDRWTVENLQIRNGANQLHARAAGNMRDVSGQVSLAAPRIEQLPWIDRLLPLLRGGTSIEGTFARKNDHLDIRAELYGDAVSYRENHVGELHAQLSLSGNERSPTTSFSLEASGVDIGRPQFVKQLEARGEGTLNDLALDIRVQGDNSRTQTAFSVERNDRDVICRLEEFQSTWNDVSLALKAPAKIEYRVPTHFVKTEPIRLQLNGGELMVEMEGDVKRQNKFVVNAQGAALPVSLARHWLPRAPQSGTLEFSLQGQGALRDPEVKLEASVKELTLPELLAFVAEKSPGSIASGTQGDVAIAVDYQGRFSDGHGSAKVLGNNIIVDEREMGQFLLAAELLNRASSVEGNVSLALNEQPRVRAAITVDRPLPQLIRAPSNQMPFRGELTLIPSPLADWVRWVPKSTDATGTVQAHATATGTFAYPQIQGELKFADATYQGIKLKELKAVVDSTVEKLNFTVTSIPGDTGGRVAASGAIALNSQYDIDARLVAEELNLAFLKRAISGAREIGGRLNTNLRVSGTVRDPHVTGDLHVRDGVVMLIGAPELRELTIDARSNDRHIVIERADARSGSGNLHARGEAQFKEWNEGKFNAHLKYDQFRLGIVPFPEGMLSGETQIDGVIAPEEGELKIVMSATELKVPEVKKERTLHEIKASFPDVRFGVLEENLPPEERQALQLKRRWVIQAQGDPIYIRAEQINAEGLFAIAANPTEKGALALKGMAEIRRGRLRLFGNDYQVERAVVNFRGTHPPDPLLDVLVSRRFTEATVYVEVSGTASQPKLRLSSDPPDFDQSQLMTLLITGRIDTRDTGQPTDMTSVVTGAVSQAVLGALAKQLAPQVGLDVIRVATQEQQNQLGTSTGTQTKAEFGKYISNNVYVGYRRIFGNDKDENANEGTVEYRISPQWFLTAVFGDAGLGSSDLLWTVRY